MRKRLWLSALTILLAPSLSTAETAPFRDPASPLDVRVADLISRLTIEQKAALLNHKGSTVTVADFDIRADQWNQCLNGVQWNRPTTLFPSCIAMSATWNPDLVQNQVARVLSDEARAIYNGWHSDPKAPGDHKGLIYRAPVINMERNPYWGRNHEAWGEDPFLTGRMAVAYVKGLQGDDPKHLKLAATLKHYAVNNVETDRQKLNAVVPERMLREYWLPQFRDAVVEGGARSLMASYNAINGTPNNINHWLLTDLLKNEWRHDGFVVSDLGGVKTMVEGHEAGKMTYVDAVAQSLMAGCDFSDAEFEKNIPAAISAGKLTEARLDDALARVLRTRFLLGEFDPFTESPYSQIPPSVINCPAHRAVALETARQSIVLLQNYDGLLPLNRANVKRIAILGPLADQIPLNNYNGKPPLLITALQSIKDHVAPGTEILYSAGAIVGGKKKAWAHVPDETATDAKAVLHEAVKLAAEADVAIVFVDTNASVEQEGRDRQSLGLPGTQEELVEAVLAANPRTIVVEMSAGPLTVPWIKDHVPALLQAWWPGEEGGHAIADVLFGDYNPAGRLPSTVYASESQVPPLDEYDIMKGFTYLYLKGAPLYAFGHGLSYTTFEYTNLRMEPKTVTPTGDTTVSVDITNTGSRLGDEVVQLYVREKNPSVPRPSRELRGFRRITLASGKTSTVTFSLPAARLAFWDEKTHAFVTRLGAYEILVGASSADIRARTDLIVSTPAL